MMNIILSLLNVVPFIFTACTQSIPTVHPLNLTIQDNVAIPGQFPYIVSVQSLERGHICGGNIINKRWILTAAHCMFNGNKQSEAQELEILAGTIHLNTGGVRYKIEKIIVHPDLEYSVNHNDIALLQVSQNLAFDKNTSPIPLSFSEIPPGTPVLSGGWGHTPEKVSNDLHFVELSLLDTVNCIYNFPDVGIFNNNICAEPSILGKGTCSGDSGGPLVYKGELVGVLSWGRRCGGPLPEVYSKVQSFSDWIYETIEE